MTETEGNTRKLNRQHKQKTTTEHTNTPRRTQEWHNITQQINDKETDKDIILAHEENEK